MQHVLTHLSNDTEHLASRLLRTICRPLRPFIVIVFETISISETFKWHWSLLCVVNMAYSIAYLHACLYTIFNKLCCVAAKIEDTRLTAVTLMTVPSSPVEYAEQGPHTKASTSSASREDVDNSAPMPVCTDRGFEV